MSVEIAWKQNILVTDFHLLKSLLVVLGFGSQAFVCGFSRQNINSVALIATYRGTKNSIALTYGLGEKEARRPTPKWNTRFYLAFSIRA